MSHVEGIARAGYAAKGVVYGIVGAIAANAALGTGQVTGSSGALRAVLDAPLGPVALGAIAAGLACYVVWRAIGAILDPEDDGAGKRAYMAITALVHAGLAVEAARLAVQGASGGSSANGPENRTAMLMQQPFGIWLVGAVGAAIAGYGVHQLVKAWNADLGDRLSLGRLSAGARRLIVRAGRFGTGARGIVFCIIGTLVIIAALRTDPAQAGGVGDALRTLQQQPYGPYLLGLVAVGLIMYGSYQLIQARYRRIGVKGG